MPPRKCMLHPASMMSFTTSYPEVSTDRLAFMEFRQAGYSGSSPYFLYPRKADMDSAKKPNRCLTALMVPCRGMIYTISHCQPQKGNMTVVGSLPMETIHPG